MGPTMLDDEFNRQRAKVLRELAEQADPFIKKRLLNLAQRYEPSQPAKQKGPDDVARRGLSRSSGTGTSAGPSDH
ncbi:hypothetical protein CO678_36535 [Bradyrhizobium diazoefficiens]|jgi:hypothetical protein|nr:hypothetical protein CO678_36535 [Bradyrhizobium diazoefficiens]